MKISIDGFEDDVKKEKEDAEEAIFNFNSAIEKSNKVEKLVSTLNNIHKIKDIDSGFLLYNNQPFESLKTI